MDKASEVILLEPEFFATRMNRMRKKRHNLGGVKQVAKVIRT